MNSPLHSNHPTPTRTQLNSIRVFGVCPRSQIDSLRENAYGQCIAVNIAKLPELLLRSVTACAFAVHLSGNVVIEQILRYALIAIV